MRRPRTERLDPEPSGDSLTVLDAPGPVPELRPDTDAPIQQAMFDPHARGAVATGQVPRRSRRRRAQIGRRISRLQESILVLAAVSVYCATTVVTIRDAASVYLSPDGAHYLGEANNYLGRGVLDFTHPPAFPLLVAFTRAVAGPLPGVLLAMTIGVGLMYLAVYFLLRQWLPVVPALFGTSVGMLMPITAELLGWSGGAELLGIAFGVLTLACFEWWCRSGGLRGVAVGGALGLTIISHPFGVAIVLFTLGVRWVVELIHRGRVGVGWGPAGLLGIGTVAVVALPFGLVAIGYYSGIASPGSSAVGPPDLGALGPLLSWSTRENRLLLGLTVASLGAPFITFRRGATAISAALATAIVLTPILLNFDSSYRSRSIYYVPVIVAIAGAFAWVRGARWSQGRLDKRRRLALGAVILVLIPVSIATIGFVPRIQNAVPYYGPLKSDDVRLIQSLSGQPGAVATSWSGTDVSQGASMSWFMSGLAGRRAYGPSGPWLQSQPSEIRSGQDMERAFAGTAGIDNGALQISTLAAPDRQQSALAGPDRPETDIQASVPGVYSGFYFPYLVLNEAGNEYPVPINSQAGVATHVVGGMAWSYPSSGAEADTLHEALTLRGNQVTVGMRLDSGRSGIWNVHLRPAAGQYWSSLVPGEHSVTIDQTVGGQMLSATITSTTPNIIFNYEPTDPLTGGQSIAVNTTGASLNFRIVVSGVAQPTNGNRAFNQLQMLNRYKVTDVVVFKSSGTLDLFDSPCFTQGPESSSLAVFKVACPSSASGGHLR